MRAVDTNVLIRLLVRDEPTQVRKAEHFIAPGAWISHLVLVETLWVLDAVYDRTSEQIATAVHMLLNHQQLVVHDADVVVSALALFEQRPALGFSDCLVIAIARKAGHGPVGTFDRSLTKVDGVSVL